MTDLLTELKAARDADCAIGQGSIPDSSVCAAWGTAISIAERHVIDPVQLAEAVMGDINCPDVFGHREELTDSISRHLGAAAVEAEPHWPADGSGDEDDGGYDPTSTMTAVTS